MKHNKLNIKNRSLGVCGLWCIRKLPYFSFRSPSVTTVAPVAHVSSVTPVILVKVVISFAPFSVPSGYPKPTRYLVFHSISDLTWFSFENHRVAGNPKCRVLPEILRKTRHQCSRMPHFLGGRFAWKSEIWKHKLNSVLAARFRYLGPGPDQSPEVVPKKIPNFTLVAGCQGKVLNY